MNASTRVRFRLALALAALAAPAVLEAKRVVFRNVPVSMDYSIPEDLKTGETVVTSFAFTALRDIEDLRVSVEPYTGIEVLSVRTELHVAELQKGQSVNFEVRVKLTGEKHGELFILCRARSGNRPSRDSVSVTYGARPGK